MPEKLTIRKMPVGGEVKGLEPGDEHDPAVRHDLFDAWLAYGFLVFRRISSAEQHLAVSRIFGELELHPLEFMRSEDEPLLMELGGKRQRGRALVYDDRDMRLGRLPWHRDTAYTPDICKGAMLRMLAVPSRYGETLFADTAMAYDELPAELKLRLEQLEYTAALRPIREDTRGATWSKMRLATRQEDSEGFDSALNVQPQGPVVIHPMVVAHPESGRKALFLSPKDSLGIVGLPAVESDELLAFLTDHLASPRFVYKHAWAADEAVLWDNRRIIHAALGYEVGERRWAVRTTLSGALRTGRYLDGGVEPSQDPVTAD